MNYVDGSIYMVKDAMTDLLYDGFRWIWILDGSRYDERCDDRLLRMWCTEEMAFC